MYEKNLREEHTRRIDSKNLQEITRKEQKQKENF